MELASKLWRMNKHKLIEYIIWQSRERKIPVDPKIFGVLCLQELYDYIIKHIHPELTIMSGVSRSEIPKSPFWKETIGILQDS